jgi:hypothetical protein
MMVAKSNLPNCEGQQAGENPTWNFLIIKNPGKSTSKHFIVDYRYYGGQYN